MGAVALAIAACSAATELAIGSHQMKLPPGVVVQQSTGLGVDGFDQDHSVRVILQGDSGVVGSLRTLLEPFDPVEGVAVELVESEYYDPQLASELDPKIFTLTDEPTIKGLSGYASAGRYPLRWYFYPDGRRAIFCAVEDAKSDRTVCTKENYRDGFVSMYRFMLKNHAQIEDIDRQLSSLLEAS